jgi:hypothetical protein
MTGEWSWSQAIAQFFTVLAAALTGAYAAWRFSRYDSDRRRLMDVLRQLQLDVNEFHLSLIASRSHVHEWEILGDARKRLPRPNYDRIAQTERDGIETLKWMRMSAATLSSDCSQLKMLHATKSDHLRRTVEDYLQFAKIFDSKQNPDYLTIKDLDFADPVENINARIVGLWSSIYGERA